MPISASVEREIVQDVLVFDVAEDGDEVSVGLYGGSPAICGSVRFTFRDPARRRANLAILQRWERETVPLTLVNGTGSTISLVNDRALISRALT